MEQSLQLESEKLARSWMRHEASWLRQYLLAGVEDPRLNLQSIFSRHFLVRAALGERFAELMEQEYGFAAVMNWLTWLTGRAGESAELEAVAEALRRRADNAEGIEVPRYVAQAFAALPIAIGPLTVPNYVEAFLLATRVLNGRAELDQGSLSPFCRLWKQALADEAPVGLRVLEPACGSANDYRFLEACGLARLVEYTGFDLCSKNVENARALFPGVRFEEGNVFEINAPDKAFDFCIVQDLFEHLSLEGMRTAMAEICRVTRQGICAGFFQMDEVPEHVVRPLEDYYCNLLSMARTRELFDSHGFAAQVVHIGTFLHQRLGCGQTHNPNAYTFFLHRV